MPKWIRETNITKIKKKVCAIMDYCLINKNKI